MADIIAEGITDSPEVASALAYFIMAAAGALTLYATSHFSPERREKRWAKKHSHPARRWDDDPDAEEEE